VAVPRDLILRRHMMHEWSEIIDAWVGGEKRAPVLIRSSMLRLELDPTLELDGVAVA